MMPTKARPRRGRLGELADTQIERRRKLREEANADSGRLEYHKDRDARRFVARQELLE
jgi:hypothetical protein